MKALVLEKKKLALKDMKKGTSPFSKMEIRRIRHDSKK